MGAGGGVKNISLILWVIEDCKSELLMIIRDNFC